jgi:hypothetical protein
VQAEKGVPEVELVKVELLQA